MPPLSRDDVTRNRRPVRREQADRLTLLDRWHHFVLDQPVLVHPGEIICVEDDNLLVQRASGVVDAHPGFTNR